MILLYSSVKKLICNDFRKVVKQRDKFNSSLADKELRDFENGIDFHYEKVDKVSVSKYCEIAKNMLNTYINNNRGGLYMSERYKIKVENGDMHLFKEAAIFDEDCGKLHKTFTGKLTTNNLFSINYELEDISGFFSSGEKYRVKKSNGEDGIMTKCGFSNYYDYE